MEFFTEWLAITLLMTVAMISPGPDFIMAARNALIYSRRTGFFTALGFALGVCVHVTYCIIGIAALVNQSVLAFSTLKYIGGAYLVYIGCKALRSNGFTPVGENHEKRADISWYKATSMGFLTNLLNPKATLFFFALFTQFINPHTPLSVQLVYGFTAFATNIMWFSFVAFVLTDPRVKARFLKFSKIIDHTCGALMIALGFKLAMSKI
ncbi:MAG: LysE family translocator [Alphaproteobacteria bacterium]